MTTDAQNHLPVHLMLIRDIEQVGVRCLDGGKCHHQCVKTCFRKVGCVPLSIAESYLNDDWTLKTPSASEPTVGEPTTFRNWWEHTGQFHKATGRDAGADYGMERSIARAAWKAAEKVVAVEPTTTTWRCVQRRAEGDGGVWTDIKYARTHQDMVILHDQGYTCTQVATPAVTVIDGAKVLAAQESLRSAGVDLPVSVIRAALHAAFPAENSK